VGEWVGVALTRRNDEGFVEFPSSGHHGIGLLIVVVIGQSVKGRHDKQDTDLVGCEVTIRLSLSSYSRHLQSPYEKHVQEVQH
jgi:hypothetical protein